MARRSSPRLERLVPVEAGVAAPDLELATCIEDLDAGEPFDLLELIGAQAAPVRVRDEGHAAVCAHPGDGLLEPGEIGCGRLGIRLDAEREHVRVGLPVPAQRVELSPRNDQQALRRRLDRADPVVGDDERVEPGFLVVADEVGGRELAVRIGRVRVKRTFEPGAFLEKDV